MCVVNQPIDEKVFSKINSFLVNALNYVIYIDHIIKPTISENVTPNFWYLDANV